MTIQEAKLAGVEAYETGKNRAPALNQSFLEAACNAAADTCELMRAFIKGWDIANLADGAIEGCPSIASLAAIKAA